MKLLPYYYIALGVASLLGISTLLIDGIFSVASLFI